MTKTRGREERTVQLTSATCLDLREWLARLSIEDLHLIHMQVRSIIWWWVGEPSAKFMEHVQRCIPKITECIDFAVVQDRLRILGQLPKDSSGKVALRTFFPELYDVVQICVQVVEQKNVQGLTKAEAWLQAVAATGMLDIDLEAAVYLASRGRGHLVDGSTIEREWRAEICDHVRNLYSSRRPKHSAVKRADAGDLSVHEAAELLRRVDGSLPAFWTFRDADEHLVPATLLRAAEWYRIIGFDDWWKSATHDLSTGPQYEVDPEYSGWCIFAWCRSDLALQMAKRKGLEAWLWSLLNASRNPDMPWLVSWPTDKGFVSGKSIEVAATLAFLWKRIGPQGFPEHVLQGCLDMIMGCQKASGGWPRLVNESESCIITTGLALHALALNKPQGWARAAERGATWLWSQQDKFGYWALPDGEATTWLTVLVLDAIALATGGGQITFRIDDRTRQARRTRTSTTSNPDPVYSYDGMSWHRPSPPQTRSKSVHSFRTGEQVDAVLITATKIELEQVLHLLRPPHRQNRILKIAADDETYYLGRFGSFRVAVLKCDMGSGGPTGAGLAANAALELWKPAALIMVGIAFAADRRKHQPADVLVGNSIVPYEGQRLGKSVTLRAPVPPTSSTLRNRFENALGWCFLRPDGSKVAAHSGPLLSGDKLIDNPRFKKHLLRQFPAAIGGEMEAAGIWAAAARNRMEWIVVKAVCDWADGKKHDGYQEMAAAAAASLCQFVLSDRNAMDGLIPRARQNTARSVQPRGAGRAGRCLAGPAGSGCP